MFLAGSLGKWGIQAFFERLHEPRSKSRHGKFRARPPWPSMPPWTWETSKAGRSGFCKWPKCVHATLSVCPNYLNAARLWEMILLTPKWAIHATTLSIRCPLIGNHGTPIRASSCQRLNLLFASEMIPKVRNPANHDEAFKGLTEYFPSKFIGPQQHLHT